MAVVAVVAVVAAAVYEEYEGAWDDGARAGLDAGFCGRRWGLCWPLLGLLACAGTGWAGWRLAGWRFGGC